MALRLGQGPNPARAISAFDISALTDSAELIRGHTAVIAGELLGTGRTIDAKPDSLG